MEGIQAQAGHTRAQGQAVEQAACRFLQQQGLVLLETNYTLRRGEIDLVMQQGRTIVFVEVRYRRSDRFGTPAESVTRSKQRKLWLAARHWLASHPQHASQPCRIDIVAARPGESGLQFEWLPNALGA